MINRTGIENDIDLRQAQRAYEGVSFRSEKRGEMLEKKAVKAETIGEFRSP